MAWKSIPSKNPLKKEVVKLIREKTGMLGAKITNVKESPEQYCGDVMMYNPSTGKYDKIGTVTIDKINTKEQDNGEKTQD